MVDPLRHTTARQAHGMVSLPPAPTGSLLHARDISYVGAIRFPTYYPIGDSVFSYGGRAIAFNPANNSLFMIGHDYDQAICEVTIPTPVNSANLADLNTAVVLQDFKYYLNRIPNNTLAGRTLFTGGLMVANGKLYGTTYDYYDGNGTAVGSHFVLDSLNVTTANVTGFFRVGDGGGIQAGMVAGYMAPIPAAHQAALGAPCMTGQGNIGVIGRTSSGPGVFGFDPAAFSNDSIAPTVPYLYYPVNHPLGPYEGPANPIESGLAAIGGMVFVPGTRSVLFFGSTGNNFEGYGFADDWGDAVVSGKGNHTFNGEYSLQVWAYDVNDLVAVKNGAVPYDCMPYDVWNFTVPILARFRAAGVAFDPATSQIYLSILDEDRVGESRNPLVHVFQAGVPLGTAAGPNVGTLAATTTETTAYQEGATGPKAGPVTAGFDILLTAGNVYPITSGASVTGLNFYKDGVLLGAGTPGGTDRTRQNWTRTVPTTGWTSGAHTLSAIATDSGGRTSVAKTYPLTIA